MTNVPPAEWHATIDARRQVIGRSPEADIPIWPKYRGVSRRHAEIWSDEHGVRIRDLGSKAGTCVNGIWLKPVQEAMVTIGDRICLATLELQLVDRLSPLEHESPTNVSSVCDSDEDATDRWKAVPIPMRLLLEKLTPAEVEVALWICRGYFDDQEVGRLLHRSPNTIRTHVGNILRKLNLRSRQELVGWLRLRQP